jgi:hypothetical protein
MVSPKTTIMTCKLHALPRVGIPEHSMLQLTVTCEAKGAVSLLFAASPMPNAMEMKSSP